MQRPQYEEFLNLLTVRSQLDAQSLECHLKYVHPKMSPKSPKMEYFENTLFYFCWHVKSHANSLLDI